MDTVRRVRAARGSLNLSLDDFAKAIGVGRQTLVRIENGSREPREHEYKAMAAATGLPLEFFTVPDLTVALAGTDQRPTLTERIDHLEARELAREEALRELRTAVLELVADNVRQTQARLERDDTDRRAQGQGADG